LVDVEHHLVGNALYFHDQVCLALRCDRGSIQENIALINPRVGLYQTIYASLLIDIGYLGLILLVISILLYFLCAKVDSVFLPIVVYSSIIITTSGIENYFYNGLGFVRFVVFLMIWMMISKKFVISSLRPKSVRYDPSKG